MNKFKIFFNFEKEENWINNFGNKGYQLLSKSFGFYSFKKVNEEKIVRIDYRLFKNKKDYVDYLLLFEDSGWKHIIGRRYSGTHYFLKMSNTSTNDIFSDQRSKAGKYQRLADMWMTMFIIYVPFFIIFLSNESINLSMLLNPKSLYLTNGIWEMNGFEFWKAFLFETPFALMRALMMFFIPVVIIIYLIFAIKGYLLYYKNLNAKK